MASKKNSKATRTQRKNARRLGGVGRNWSCEPLEERLALTADSVGDPSSVGDLITIESSAAIAATEVNSIVVYEGAGAIDSHGIFVEVKDADGNVISAATQVNTQTRGVQSDAVVAADENGGFVVAWSGRGEGDLHGIFFQRYASDGTKLGSATLVNDVVGGRQVDPAIAVNENGTFVIAWAGVGTDDFSGIFMQRYNASGVAQGDVVSVNTTKTDDQSSPSVAFDSADNIAVVWQSRHQDGEDWGIYGQWYTSAGLTIGTETQINTTTADSQSNPTVAIDPSGGVVVAWQSREQDGDSWGVVARHFNTSGAADSVEVLLNDDTAGHQKDVAIAVGEDGQWLVAWTSGSANGAGWEVVSRSFDADGVAAASFVVNEEVSGANSGHQQTPQVAIVEEKAIVTWNGVGSESTSSVYAQEYLIELIDDGDPTAPVLADINDDAMEVGEVLELRITATDVNFRDDLTFTLDTSVSPAGATIEQIDNYTAIIRWAPSSTDLDTDVDFRVIVTDDSDDEFTDTKDFKVSVGATALSIDLNGPNETGVDATVNYVTGSGAALITDSLLQIRGADGGTIKSATVVLAATPDDTDEVLTVDTTGTSITATYDTATRTLTLSGEDSTTAYHDVLKSLRYDNTSDTPSGTRTLQVAIIDSSDDTASATIDMTIVSPDLVGFAQALTDSGATLYGADWYTPSTDQREIFEDGGQYLPFVESTDPDRSSNQVAIDNSITDVTWVFGNGVRVEAAMTLAEISEASGIEIPVATDPTFVEISDQALIVGSPSIISLDGYDANGGKLTYTFSSDNTDVTGEILSGNSSIAIDVAGYGEMVFELFEEQAPLATAQILSLAEDDFYDDVIFHRIIDEFVIQGGDPTGTGSGGSDLGDFDDQFDVDLQHNRTGLLSMAKSSDDTNDSQFFITEGENTSNLRNLDFNHTIFGVMTEGEAVRESISRTEVDGSTPAEDIVIEDVRIFEDNENGVLILKAADGATGTAEITVTVEDEDGNTWDQTFTVTLEEDTYNGTPFLGELSDVTADENTTASLQLTSSDVEGDDVFYFAEKEADETIDYTFTVSDSGLVEVTPPTDFVGDITMLVAVGNTDVIGEVDDIQLVTFTFTEVASS